MAKKNKNKDRKQDAPSALRAEAPRAAASSPSRAEPGPQPASGAAPGSQPTVTVQGQAPLFYQKLRPLHLTDHADLKLKSPMTYEFAAATVAVPVLLGEFLTAGRDYPIVFGPADPPVPVAFMGLYKGQNLYVNKDGSWEAGAYIPAYIRRCPFLLAEVGEAKRRILFVDEASPNVVRGGEGVPLIADGKPSETATNALRFCEAYAYDQEQTRMFGEALVALGLLEPRNINLVMPGGQKILLKDIRVISPKKFEELPDSVYLDWRKRKWLFPAYCHFQSGINWQHLVDRIARARAKAKS